MGTVAGIDDRYRSYLAGILGGTLDEVAHGNDISIVAHHKDGVLECLALGGAGSLGVREAGPGDNFKDCYAAIKQYDQSRPVQYERNNDIVDIGSNQYPSIAWVQGAVQGKYKLKYPFHISEYAHSMGNACGNLIDYWDAIESTNFFMGGAIWDWVDQALDKQDPATGKTYWAYGGDFGKDNKPNDGMFCMNGIMRPDLSPKIAELNAPVVVEVLHTRYPQGAEKQLVQAVSGRQVPSGKLPADAGCCIFNLNTTCAIYRAVYEGMPVVNKIVTVSGSGVIEPKNIECPIGTPITKLFDACGGLKDETYKLIMGGPMMGLAQYDLDVTVGKGTGAMLAFADKEEQYVEDPQCIRCGKCVGVCPIRLEPIFMYKYLMKGDVDTWQNVLHGMDCIECGACTYTCPARLPLTHAFRLGKQEVNNARMAAKAKAEAEAKAAAEKKEA